MKVMQHILVSVNVCVSDTYENTGAQGIVDRQRGQSLLSQVSLGSLAPGQKKTVSIFYAVPGLWQAERSKTTPGSFLLKTIQKQSQS